MPHSAGGGSAAGSADRVNNRTSVGSNNSNSGVGGGFVGIAGEGLAQHLGKRKSPAEKGTQCFLCFFSLLDSFEDVYRNREREIIFKDKICFPSVC